MVKTLICGPELKTLFVMWVVFRHENETKLTTGIFLRDEL